MATCVQDGKNKIQGEKGDILKKKTRGRPYGVSVNEGTKQI